MGKYKSNDARKDEEHGKMLYIAEWLCHGLVYVAVAKR